MKFFCVDMHISVMKDIEHIFGDLGHEVRRESLSGHNWVDGINDSKLSIPSRGNWQEIGPAMVKKFYAKYKNAFQEYDGFIHSYPPAFALLFEQFGKPVITITCTRFDYPVFPVQFQWLSAGLRRMVQTGQLILLANNKLDKFYNETFLGIPTQHISSLCNYLDQKDGTESPDFLLWTRGGQSLASRYLNTDFSIKQKYDREKIKTHAGVIHLPYNLSIMSAFEHYWQNIPLFFPSLRFQTQLWKEGAGALCEVLFENTALYFDENLIHLADWYDEDNFYGVQFFDGFDELEMQLQTVNLEEVSNWMATQNHERKIAVYSQWERVLEKLR